MQTKFQRGLVDSIEPGKDGSVICRVGNQPVTLHPDLAGSIAHGDDIAVAGEVKNEMLHATAIRNFKQDKFAEVDCTNYILLMALGIIVFILFGILGVIIGSDSSMINSAADVASIAGFVLAALTLRRFIQMIRAASWAKYAEL